MKANELRLGNLLYNDKVVVTIDAKTIFDIWNDEGLKNYSPIPLTEEWLIKFGFKKEEDCFNKDGFKLWEADGKYYHINSETITYFDYVHHLQNYYYFLTYINNEGEELTI